MNRVIEVRGLSKDYGPTLGLDSLDLDIERGEVFGFLGPNGAGKTTTIRLLLDLIRPTRGSARLFGQPGSDPAVRSRIGYLSGELALDERLSGNDFCAFLGSLHDPSGRRGRRDELCERLGLASDALARPIRDYSRGMKQKLGIVVAFQHDPDLLILDEPTTALDPLVREAVFDLLLEAGRAGKTVFHSSHVLTEVDRTCSRVGFIRNGKLLSVMRVDEVHRSGTRRMELRFSGDAPVSELRLPGVELVEQQGPRVVLRISGELNPLLGVLARHPVERMVFPEPTLEEAFVGFYKEDRR